MSLDWKDFQGVNAAFALELYEKFRANPNSVDAATRAFFERVTPADAARLAEDLGPGTGQGSRTPDSAPRAESIAPLLAVGAINFIQSIRRYGHLAAEIDPLGSRRLGDPMLVPETHGVTE